MMIRGTGTTLTHIFQCLYGGLAKIYFGGFEILTSVTGQVSQKTSRFLLTGYVGLILRSTAEATVVGVPLRVLWGYAAATACMVLLLQ